MDSERRTETRSQRGLLTKKEFMYEWRKMTDEERAKILIERKGRRLPWHSPPHLEFAGLVTFIITAACYEHKNIIGKVLKEW